MIQNPRILPALNHLFVTKIACGRNSSAVLTKDGDVFCFGSFCNAEVPPDVDPVIEEDKPTFSNLSPTVDCSLEEFSIWGAEGLPFQFKIVSLNSSNQRQKGGGDVYRVLMKSSTAGHIKGNVEDNQDGSYTVTLLPNFCGENIEIDVRLVDSPKAFTKKVVTLYPTNSVQLLLPHKSLKILHSHIEAFSNLMHLDISNNELEELPRGIAHLHKLMKLNAASNRLKSIPFELGLLQDLKHLDLSDNPLMEWLQPILNFNGNIETTKGFFRLNDQNSIDWNALSKLFR